LTKYRHLRHIAGEVDRIRCLAYSKWLATQTLFFVELPASFAAELPSTRALSLLSLEAEVPAVVYGQSYLLGRSPAPVVPEEPAIALVIVDGKGLVAGIAIPCVASWKDDRVGSIALPAGYAVSRTCQASLGVMLVAEADVEHQIVVCAGDDLAGSGLVLFPGAAGPGSENGIGRNFSKIFVTFWRRAASNM